MPGAGTLTGLAGGAIRAATAVARAGWPLLAGYAAWLLAAELWGDLIAVLPPGSRSHALAWNAWPTAALAGPILVMTGTLALRRPGSGRGAAFPAIAMVAAAALLTAGPELARLDVLPMPWPERLRLADVNIIMAVAFGLLAATAGLIALGNKSARDPGVKRARSDAFGHADWMSMAEARRLFDARRSAQGGVVIGEAYRVDQDRVAAVPFDPRQPATWGRGGKAPLLVFDLSWGGTHGLVFAGSGAYKTVSVCVPTLLCYRGPVVTLDPSAELAPMLTPARRAMGRRVITIDPARPEASGFNALDWLDVMSPTIDADIRAVVEWIAGERPSESALAPIASGRQFFEGRGKALIEALLSDLVFASQGEGDPATLAALADRLALPEAAMREELQRVHHESSSPRARHLAGQLMGLVPETFSGVYGAMSEQTEWLANPRYAALVSATAFTTGELAAGAVDLFLNLPLATLQSTPALARVIVGSLLAAVYRADGHLPGGRIVFLLDEVARLGPMAALARARDAGRKYGITLVLLYQSEGQLREQWSDGGKAAWFESASWRAYAAVSSPEQARALAEACGEHGIVTASESTSASRSSKLLSPATRSTGTQRSERPRRLVTPSEILADARSDEQFVFVTGRKPLRCGRALYFRRPEMKAKVRANRFAREGSSAAM